MKLILEVSPPFRNPMKKPRVNTFVLFDAGNNLFSVDYPPEYTSKQAREQFYKEFGFKNVKCRMPQKVLDAAIENNLEESEIIKLLKKRMGL